MNGLQKFSLPTTSSKSHVFEIRSLEYDVVVPKSGEGNVIAMYGSHVHAPLPPGYRELSDMTQDHEKIPKRAAALARARQRLAARVFDQQTVTLASLRLQAGLSQAKLADLLGNSQPSYSLIESGKREIMHATFERLHEILNVSRDTLAEALRNSRDTDA